MSGAMRKMGVYLGLLEDTGRYEDDYYAAAANGDEVHEVPQPRSGATAASVASGATVASLATATEPATAPTVAAATLTALTDTERIMLLPLTLDYLLTRGSQGEGPGVPERGTPGPSSPRDGR